jgi:protoheme IX farnesyltransferase
MATEPILAPLHIPVGRHLSRVSHFRFKDYWALTKPEINLMVAISTGASFFMGAEGHAQRFPWATLIHTVFGTLLLGGGAAALNQWMELPFDVQMRRTARRPVAAGKIEPLQALWFGVGLSLVGAVYLAVLATPLAAVLAVVTLLSYLFLYTPLKRKTPLCTLIGAIPGAAAPLIGWAAGRGSLEASAWGLFGILFLWQFPHFMSIAWMHRDDYARAGYRVLPPEEKADSFINLQVILPSVGLLFLTSLPAIGGVGWGYAVASLAAGCVFFYYCFRFALEKTSSSARRLLAASICYLPTALILIVIGRA